MRTLVGLPESWRCNIASRWNYMKNRSTCGVDLAWYRIDAFGLWLIRNGWRPGDRLVRIDPRLPFGPDNCRIQNGGSCCRRS